MRRTVLLFVSFVALADPASGWQVRVPGTVDVGPVVLQPTTGDVLAAVALRRVVSDAAAVVRLRAPNGRQRWRQTFHGRGRKRAVRIYGLVATPGGDVVAVGTVYEARLATFFVGRLAGSNGAVRWQRSVLGAQHTSLSIPKGVVLDPTGDVVVAGTLEGATTGEPYHDAHDFAVVKLAADSGDERWRFTLNGDADRGDEALAVAVDPAGDLVATGTVGVPEPNNSLLTTIRATAVKLGATDGHLIWRSTLDDVRRAGAVALDAAGDVFLAGTTEEPTGHAFAVVKLAGATGSALWVARVKESDRMWQEAVRVGVLPSGDVVAVGFTVEPAGEQVLTAVRLDGSTGTERWRRLLHGSDGSATGDAVAIDPAGAIVVGGELRNTGSCQDATVARLADGSGEPVDVTTIDGRSVASRCEDPYCPGESCPVLAFDNDALTALAVDAAGHPVVAGALADGRRGQKHGFVAVLP